MEHNWIIMIYKLVEYYIECEWNIKKKQWEILRLDFFDEPNNFTVSFVRNQLYIVI